MTAEGFEVKEVRRNIGASNMPNTKKCLFHNRTVIYGA